jgi:DNA (cytosine-5)-methyltransferase 1
MRVFSTFSGISAATAAWRPMGWTFVGYAEVNPYACAVLAARCGATRPKYMPYAEHAYLMDESGGLLARLNELSKGNGSVVQRYSEQPLDFENLNRFQREEAYERFHETVWKQAAKELKKREELLRLHRRTSYDVVGAVPNFGDIWSITDDDLKALGPVDLLEGGSPCQAFSSAGKETGLIDFRSALMLAYLDLVERMRRINGLKWVLWENVKGVLGDNGNGFGHLLGRLVKERGTAVGRDGLRYANAGYVSGPDGSVAWRVLDSQHFGRPQRRERVFALGYVGMGPARMDPRDILFEPVGEGSAAPRKKKPREEAALALSGRSAGDVPRSERLAVFMAGQTKAAFSIAESRTVCPTLRSVSSGSNSVPRVAYALDEEAGRSPDPSVAAPRYVVRKLLPVEAERIQGFDDGWTEVLVNGKVMPDIPRHACIGNSMTVDVMRWIGERLDGATGAGAKAKAA